MLDLTKLESGAMPVNLRHGDIKGYLGFLVELFRSGAISRNLELKMVSDHDRFEMDFDSDKIMHILSNLLSNALKFTPEGGTVVVSADMMENGKKYRITVKDTGIGINQEDMQQLFNRFYQVHNGVLNGGTGLGLAITKELVDLLKGTISVSSTFGSGSEFKVVLPVTHCALAMDRSELTGFERIEENLIHEINPSPEVDPDIGPQSVILPVLLIVEDNHDVAQYL